MTHEENREGVRLTNELRKKNGLEPLPKMAISFSGGRTSAVMTKLIWDRHQATHDIIITFANTGCEHEKTLDFVKQCTEAFGWPVVWLEALVNQEAGKGVRHRVVTYETASRNGEPFKDVVSKYGIFNLGNPSCTARTKTDPMESFIRSCGWSFGKSLDHSTAIGIRADEMDRMSQRGLHELGFIYPMVTWGVTKRKVGLEIARWGFDLQIPGDHFGNCTWCWKKSLRKHLTLAKECPEVFDFPERMEREHGKCVGGRKNGDGEGNVRWFRKHLSVADIKEMARTRLFQPYADDGYEHGWERELDLGGSCGDSCEIGADLE